MTESFAQKLCCPIDKHDLETRIFVKHENGEILEALLTCKECSRYYPVIYGIPIMTPDEYRDKSLEDPVLRKWNLSLPSGNQKSFQLEKRTSATDQK